MATGNFWQNIGPKVHFWFLAERFLSPKQYVVMSQTETVANTWLSEAMCVVCLFVLVFISTVLDALYKNHYLNVEIKQRACEMTQTAMDAENPWGDRERTRGRARSECRKKDLSLYTRMRSMHFIV